jgi:SAM-dependent methyltransferase
MESDDATPTRRFFRAATPNWLKRRLLPFEFELNSLASSFCLEHGTRVGLDVACGNTTSGVGVIGLDLQFSSLNGGQNRVCGDALALPFQARSFDFILCNAALHHFQDPRRALVEMRRTIRPGGDLLLTVPDRFPKTNQPDDYFRFGNQAISELLSDAGWKVVECSPIGGSFWAISRHSLEWLFRWTRGPYLAVFAISAPVAGVALPLACFYMDALAPGGRTLGWAVRAINP